MFNKDDFSARKTFMNGTDRLVPPAETLERVKPHFEKLGITRVANITGLDRIGIPVVEAVRPNSRSLSVTQGKGLSLDAAKVSAIMESLECWHAENPVIPIHLDTASKLSESNRVITLPDDMFSPIGGNWTSIEIPWVQAHQISDGDPVFVPYDFVHFDTRPHVQNEPSRKIFARGLVTTNGLASGNHLLEAANHAISELIERDAYYKWERMTTAERISTSVNLETVDDSNCNWMLDRILAAGFKPLVQDITSDVNVPAFRCAIGAEPKHGVKPEPFFLGWGCHPRREIALLRAISEAAQARLTEISGSRDNLTRASYIKIQDQSQLIKNWEYVSKAPAIRNFMELPTYPNDTFEADTSILLHQLERVGIDEVLIVDLTHREIGIPVVKVVCPALNYGRKHG
jgi:ribosomal protein S12 methylthiotransferase accessory factor